jgi:ABC-type uncharacterized transport system YnjBCD ATPase subunit
LLDEPLSALDPATRSTIRGELADILRTLDLTTLIVTHDREEAFEPRFCSDLPTQAENRSTQCSGHPVLTLRLARLI